MTCAKRYLTVVLSLLVIGVAVALADLSTIPFLWATIAILFGFWTWDVIGIIIDDLTQWSVALVPPTVPKEEETTQEPPTLTKEEAEGLRRFLHQMGGEQ